MIGVAFSLQKAFGTATGVESAAFTRSLGNFARVRGLTIDVTHVERASASEYATIRSSADLRTAFSTALSPHLLDAGDALELEATFRLEATRLVAERFLPFADVAPTLREIASLNIPCVAVSGWPSIDRHKALAVGFGGPLVIVEDLGTESGSPAMFARIAQKLSLPADCLWFVGTDVATEILPAAAAGLHTIWLNRDEQEFPASRTSPDATVTAFGELLGVLGEPYTRGLLALRYILRTALCWRPGYSVSASDPVVVEDGEPEVEPSERIPPGR